MNIKQSKHKLKQTKHEFKSKRTNKQTLDLLPDPKFDSVVAICYSITEDSEIEDERENYINKFGVIFVGKKTTNKHEFKNKHKHKQSNKQTNIKGDPKTSTYWPFSLNQNCISKYVSDEKTLFREFIGK